MFFVVPSVNNTFILSGPPFPKNSATPLATLIFCWLGSLEFGSCIAYKSLFFVIKYKSISLNTDLVTLYKYLALVFSINTFAYGN